jgi:hypothetical protein
VIYENYSFDAPPKTRKLDEGKEEEIANFIKTAKEDIQDRIDLMGDLEEEDIDRYLTWAADYVRRGYRKAQKRFPDNYEAAYLFRQIADRAKKLLDHEGQKLVVSLTNNRLRVWEEYEDGYREEY